MIAKTPPMGFNTWNTFGPDINDQVIRETADAMVEQGLLDAGYEYLVVDDCWSERERDPVTKKIVADRKNFPDGMKAVADYVHSKGLKFGMYTCAGMRTCAGYPGSYRHEFLDAETFAEIGVDFLKYDFCCMSYYADGPMLYRKMGIALKATGREILYSMCNWGKDDVWKWARAYGAHMYRSTGDICDNFKSYTDIAMSQKDLFCHSGPYCFNDMDMLTVGMYGKGNVAAGGCSSVEYKSQFALWCLFGTPLMLGCDVRSMDDETRALVTDRELIRINQDPEARGIITLNANPWNGDYKAFMRHLSNNESVIGLFNLGDSGTRKPVFLMDDFGLDPYCGYGLQLTNLFTGEEIGPISDYFEVPENTEPHDCVLYRAKFVKV